MSRRGANGAGMGGAGCMNQKDLSKTIVESAEANQAAILPVSPPQPYCNHSLVAQQWVLRKKADGGVHASGFF
jgi:hypothetical protein